MNHKREVLVLQGVRELIEEGTDINIGEVRVTASDVLADVCRAFALSDEEIAVVLGEVQTSNSDTVVIPVLGAITGGPEDALVWGRVHAFFGA